jgi:hypothetical protein
MPEKVIGTKLNPRQETVWRGHIEILKDGNEYTLKPSYEGGEGKHDPDIDKRILELLKNFVQQLSRDAKRK